MKFISRVLDALPLVAILMTLGGSVNSAFAAVRSRPGRGGGASHPRNWLRRLLACEAAAPQAGLIISGFCAH